MRTVTITCDVCGERQEEGAPLYALGRVIVALDSVRCEERFGPVLMGQMTACAELCSRCAGIASEAMTAALEAERVKKGAAVCARA